MKAINSLTSQSWREHLGSFLREHQLAAFGEILIVIAIYLLKIHGWLPMSKIPILLFGSISLWLRGSGWRQVGLGRPESWRRTIFLGIGIAVLDTVLGWMVTLPLLHRITGEVMDLSSFAEIRGNIGMLLFWLILSWTYAAIAEEMVYRGYLLNRLTDLFGHHKLGYGLSIIFSSVMFGLVHGSMGVPGILNTFLSGVLYAGVYLAFRRNLWVPVIVHGVGNTIGMVMIYYGSYPW